MTAVVLNQFNTLFLHAKLTAAGATYWVSTIRQIKSKKKQYTDVGQSYMFLQNSGCRAAWFQTNTECNNMPTLRLDQVYQKTDVKDVW
jgi:hypothetical protein